MRRTGGWAARCGALAVVLLACGTTRGGSGAAGPPGGSADVAGRAGAAPPAGCPIEKLRFTRETACRNDGYLEFCVPKGDAALEARIRAAAPSAAREPEWRGRAGCDDARETHYALPTRDPALCWGPWGELTDAGWETICRLASLPEIAAIVPTIWYR